MWRDYPGLFGQVLNVITSVRSNKLCMRDSRQRRKNHVMMEAEGEKDDVIQSHELKNEDGHHKLEY